MSVIVSVRLFSTGATTEEITDINAQSRKVTWQKFVISIENCVGKECKNILPMIPKRLEDIISQTENILFFLNMFITRECFWYESKLNYCILQSPSGPQGLQKRYVNCRKRQMHFIIDVE